MSKELAQTVGGKKIAALFAILALLTVFATLGSHWQKASALVTPQVFTVVQTPDAAPAANIAPGSTGTFVFAYTQHATIAASNLIIYGDAISNLTYGTPTGTGAIGCTTGATFSCNPGVLGAAGTLTLTVPWTAGAAAGTIVSATTAFHAKDGVSDATVVNATDSSTTLGTLTIIAPVTSTLAKSSQTGIAAGGATTSQTITVTNNTGGNFTGSSLTITDAIPAGITVTGVTIANSGVASAALAQANCGVTNSAGPFTLTCVVNFTASEWDATSDTVTLTVNQTVSANTGAQRTLTDTATLTASVGAINVTDSQTGSITQDAAPAAALPNLCPGLFHVDPWGNLILGTVDLGADGVAGGTGDNADCTKAGARDVSNNVVGFDHRVCLVGSLTSANSINVTAIQPPSTAGIRFNIVNVSGAVNVNGQALVSVNTTNATTAQFVNGGPFSECVRWYSTGTGEQNITVVDTNGNVIADWADGPTNGADVGAGTTTFEPITSQTPLVKEWNILIPTTITATAAVQVAGPPASVTQGTNVDQNVTLAPNGTAPAVFNPATSRYSGGPVTYYENVLGTHTNSAGTNVYLMIGARVTFTHTGSCGTVSLTNAATYTGPVVGNAANPGNAVVLGQNPLGTHQAVTVTSVGVSIPFAFQTDSTDTTNGCSVLNNSTTGVTISVTYPNDLGSANPVVAAEKIQITWVSSVATKQVFLAWAGQRVILEHDWRIMPGDVDGGTGDNDPDALGTCPWNPGDDDSVFPVTYIKGSGPGNFLPSLGAIINGSDQATVIVENEENQSDDEVPSLPQENCISRVLFESEDQGQVDIEAFVDPAKATGDAGSGRGWVTFPDPMNQTKIAFVIYYMKLESATVSLVDDVSKPSHNSSVYAYADWNPGNPWDATKDVSTVDWNVSKDLLVRVRVKGWFTTSNTTGRAAGTDTNGGGLPAGRWVMPDDWPLLAGGPADPADGSDATGIAELYRPEFDIMIAPNNKLGRSLLNPEGTLGDVAVTTVGVAMSAAATTTTVTVASAANIPVGACIVIDSEVMSVTAKAGNVLTVTRVASPGLNCSGTTTVLAAHAVGALVIILNPTQVPFEGPYSLLDIPGLAASGFGGAALSNIDPNNIRDTIWGDTDVDMWDAPMPPSLLTVSIRGSGFIKQVLKESAYYIGTANASGQVFPNPFYIVNIPDSPFIPAVVAGGGYFWDSWGNDGPGCTTNTPLDCVPPLTDGQGVYRFWRPAIIGSNMWGVGDTSVTSAQATELAAIRTAYGDGTIARDLVVYTDNHGEAMVAANGDFKLDYSGCAANALAGGKHCAPGDKAGASTITAVADYPDFRGKHYPLLSNVATVNWTWGGYKDVTIEAGETEQYKYVVFHAMDRDAFCYVAPTGSVQLHPVLTSHSNNTFNNNQSELIDFMIDSGEGIIIGTSNGASSSSQYTKQFAEGVPTFSTYANDPAVSLIKEFPLSSLAATGATDECQAWVKVSNSLLGILDILVIAHDDEGNIGFDRIIDLQSTMSYSLSFRWTLFTWAGADGLATADALKGSGGSTNDITSSVTAVYGWDPAAQAWLGYFPSAVPVPGANDLTKLTTGDAYWIAITGPGSVTWTIATNVD